MEASPLELPSTALASVLGPRRVSGNRRPFRLTDEALVELAWLRRRVHDAGAGFDAAEVACHSDLVPYNTADEESRPIAFIDWVLEQAAELAP